MPSRGRLADDVYGVIAVTLDALRLSGGVPPSLVFAVSHHETGNVEQIGFLPPGVMRVPPGGRFTSNDPRFRPPGALPPGRSHHLEA